jgi:EmrB/QacA subfamily drug resistance transporter
VPTSPTADASAGRNLAILALAAMAVALAQTMLIPALGELGEQLDAGPNGVAWTLTGYLLAAAVCTPIIGRLGDMFGKRRLLVISLLVFALGSGLSAMGNSLEIVVVGRVLQGLGGGVFPLCFGIVRDEFPRERVPTAIGLLSAIAGIGGGVGLLLGGLIVDHVSYHWIFWAGGIMAALAAVAMQVFIPESPERTPGRIDWRGAAVMTVGLTLPLFAISRAGEWGWLDPRFLGLVLAGLVVLTGFLALQRRTTDPLVDVQTLSLPPVLMTNIATLLVGFGMFGSFILVPQLVQAPESTGYGFGADATTTGLLMLPGSLMMLVTGPLSGRIADRSGPRVALALGAVVCGLGLAAIAVLHGSELEVLLCCIVIFAGIGLAFAAMPMLIVEAVPSSQTGQATGVNALVRSIGSSVGSQMTASILAGSVLVAGAGIGHPTEGAFELAFLLTAGVAILSAVFAMRIPAGVPHHHPPVLEEIGAAAQLGDPAQAVDGTLPKDRV